MLKIDINRSHNFFLYRFLSIDIGNRYSSMVDIDSRNDCYRLSVYRLTTPREFLQNIRLFLGKVAYMNTTDILFLLTDTPKKVDHI